MERLKQKLAAAENALHSLERIMIIDKPNDIERDAAIQRFEYTFEALWKAGRQFLLDIEGIEVGSPKGVIRSCRETGILSEFETVNALQMVNDRNMTVHTYNELLAEEIFQRIKGYVLLMNTWLLRMKQKTK